MAAEIWTGMIFDCTNYGLALFLIAGKKNSSLSERGANLEVGAIKHLEYVSVKRLWQVYMLRFCLLFAQCSNNSNSRADERNNYDVDRESIARVR